MLINLQYLVANLKVYSPPRVFALLFKLFKLNLAYDNRKIYANYNKSCTKQVNLFVYFEIRDHVINSLL